MILHSNTSLHILVTTGLIAGLTAGCAGAQKPAAKVCTKTSVFGSMKTMKAGDLSQRVKLSDLQWSANAIALGATTDKTMEITAANGELWLVGPDSSGAMESKEGPGTAGATLLVYANPENWGKAISIEARTPPQLVDAVQSHSSQAGCTGDISLPFRITGHAKTVTWSTVGQPKGLSHEDQDVDVTIVGFYAPTQKGIFVPPPLDAHMHVVVSKRGHAGHLRSIELESGAALQFPQ